MSLNLIQPSLEKAPGSVTSATDVDKEEVKYLQNHPHCLLLG